MNNQKGKDELKKSKEEDKIFHMFLLNVFVSYAFSALEMCFSSLAMFMSDKSQNRRKHYRFFAECAALSHEYMQ